MRGPCNERGCNALQEGSRQLGGSRRDAVGRGYCSVGGTRTSVYFRDRSGDGQVADAPHRRELGGRHAVLQRARARVRRGLQLATCTTRPTIKTSALGEPVGPIVSAAGYQIKNLTRARLQPPRRAAHRHGLGRLQLRPGVQGQPGHRRYVRGLPHPRLHRQDEPDRGRQLHGLQRRPGRRDRLRQPRSSARGTRRASATSMCAGQLVGQGFEGIHVFDISNPAEPQFVRALRFAADNPGLVGCGSHTATAVPDPARDALYIYNGGSSGNCDGIDIFKIKHLGPDQIDDHRSRLQRGHRRQDRRRRAWATTPATTTTCCSTSAARRRATPCARAATASPCSSST